MKGRTLREYLAEIGELGSTERLEAIARFTELLEKRKTLEANIFEEEELMQLAKNLSKEELNKVDPELLTYSNSDRLGSIMNLLDKLNAVVERGKK